MEQELTEIKVDYIETTSGTTFSVKTIVKRLEDSIFITDTNDNIFEIFYRNIAFVAYQKKDK